MNYKKSELNIHSWNISCVFLPGATREVVVTFAPDHCSDFFSDGIRLQLFGQDEVKNFRVIGESKPHIMYILGGDTLQPPVQSLAVQPPTLDADGGELWGILFSEHRV